MKEKKQYQLSVDMFKMICAILVIAIHTAPLIEISPFSNYLIVQVLGRLAVPSFFGLASYYFYKKYQVAESKKKYLLSYCKRMGLLYLFASIIYLPIWIYAHPTFSIVELMKDILLDGFHYHLWYFPALIVGTVIVCLLEKYVPKKTGTIVIILFLIGSFMNVYFPFFKGLTGMEQLPIEFSRNGVFFAPVFIYCGFHIKKIVPKERHLLIVGIAYLLECLVLHGTNNYTSVTSMYLTLLLIIPILLQWIINGGKTVHSNQQLHSLSTYLYILHPMVILLIQKVYSINQMNIPNILLFLLTVIGTILLSFVIQFLLSFVQQTLFSKKQFAMKKVEIE